VTELFNHIVRAVEIAEAADTHVIMYPNQVRYLLNRIAELERVLGMVEWLHFQEKSDWIHEGILCPWCNSFKEDGHDHDCPRQKAVKP